MYMPYTTNPHLPLLRMRTANLVILHNWSIRQAARHVGVEPSTVSRWVEKAKMLNTAFIPTESSRPNHHPKELSLEMVSKIIEFRKKKERCAEVIYQEMVNAGYFLSLSSVKRTLRRQGLIRKRSPWKRWHFTEPRPRVVNPGELVQIDTIHLIPGGLYVYTLLDVFSRWAQALVSERINTCRSLLFVSGSQKVFPFRFKMLQTDHGSEFSTWFSENVKVKLSSQHRHSRVRKPNDNGHLERFNRTLQEECLRNVPKTIRAYKKIIPEYLNYYNNERLHLGLKLKTPQQVLRSY
jgi:transposase InsO family protein